MSGEHNVIARMQFQTLRAVCVLITLAVGLPVGARAQTESVIYSFTGKADGWGPWGGLVSDAAGNLYGVTVDGGDLNACSAAGCGVIYKLSPTATGWVQTVIHTFTGGLDGAAPGFGLVRDAKGNLYGITAAGGNNACLDNAGCGTIFRLSPVGNGWQETVLYTFTGGSDTSNPIHRLVMDRTGNLYGTTSQGGDLINCPSHPLGCGGAFKLSRSRVGWNFSLLYSFTDSDSSLPNSALILDAAGNLYGTGSAGPYGVVYELSPSSNGVWTDSVLYSFINPANGSGPTGLIFHAGILYGPTYSGGTGGDTYDCQDVRAGCGTLFKLSHGLSGWTETVLHNFTQNDPQPNGSLIFDKAGNLYGADSTDAFMLSRGSKGVWTMTVLHTFGGTGDGMWPQGPLLRDNSGDLFGVAYGGGLTGYGAVFEITP